MKEGLFSIYSHKYIHAFTDRSSLYINFLNTLVHRLFTVLNCIDTFTCSYFSLSFIYLSFKSWAVNVLTPPTTVFGLRVNPEKWRYLMVHCNNTIGCNYNEQLKISHLLFKEKKKNQVNPQLNSFFKCMNKRSILRLGAEYRPQKSWWRRGLMELNLA